MNDQILRKIKRCMDLSKSSNEHEAALAIKQMQALMQKHGFNEKHVLATGVVENKHELDVRKNPAQWVLNLHSSIAQALDCASIVRHWDKDWNIQLIFIGVEPAPEIASYAFEVLYKKIKQNRSDYIQDKLWRYKRSNKTKLADAYCTGWVQNVYAKIKNLNPNLEIEERINAYKETKLAKTLRPDNIFYGKVRFDKQEQRSLSAMRDGHDKAKEVNLFVATEHTEKVQIGGAYE
ncbi:DUF2786 domain-containing protein [Leifsonia sp. NPDC077715]|uniref:DUF2786 domain-containing protein n=1 Tax=Leifsonia sp. NPDC077715 TaxID=3155539 RepID=UPI0034488928